MNPIDHAKLATLRAETLSTTPTQPSMDLLSLDLPNIAADTSSIDTIHLNSVNDTNTVYSDIDGGDDSAFDLDMPPIMAGTGMFDFTSILFSLP